MVQKFISYKEGLTSCDKSIVITDFQTGEIICQNCGQVFQEKIEDSGKEWKVFDNERNRIRVGTGTSLASYDIRLSTVIDSLLTWMVRKIPVFFNEIYVKRQHT